MLVTTVLTVCLDPRLVHVYETKVLSSQPIPPTPLPVGSLLCCHSIIVDRFDSDFHLGYFPYSSPFVYSELYC